MSDSVRPHRRQPTRLPCPWDSPGKNTGVGCHFLLQCMKVKSESEVAQSCPTLRYLMDCSLPGSSIHGIFHARVLEWVAIAFSVLACEMSAIVQYFEHSLALSFFGVGMKTDLFQSMATAEFSKFPGILSAALSQHHLPGFEIAPLEFHHLH